MRQSVEVVFSHVFSREGGPQIPRSMTGPVHTWKTGHYFHGPVYLAVYGGSWKNSCIFYVNVDSRWKGTSRMCFRVQRCAWSDGSKFCGGAVHRTLEPEVPLAPLTESLTAEVLARHRSSSLSHPEA